MPSIPPIDTDAMARAAARQARLTKPAGALGRLETLSIRIAGMRGEIDWRPARPGCIVFAADYGVASQGVSAYPQAVTHQMVLNFLRGGAAINVLVRQMGAQLLVVDAGVIGDFEPHSALLSGKIARGTQNLAAGPAMDPEQAEASLALGRRAADRMLDQGVDILALGEMGIGNTTSASATIAAITGRSAAEVTGRGTGLDDSALRAKIAVVEQALARHAPAEVDTLAKLGGFEIGAIAGAALAAAEARVPVIIDGLISTAAALIAAQRDPAVVHYLIASHRGSEPGHAIALAWLGLEPLLDLNLRLGEGTGALLTLPLIEAAQRILQEMATFDEAGVSGRGPDTNG